MKISEELEQEVNRIFNNLDQIDAEFIQMDQTGWECEEVEVIKVSLANIRKLVKKIKFVEEMVERHVIPQVKE